MCWNSSKVNHSALNALSMAERCFLLCIFFFSFLCVRRASCLKGAVPVELEELTVVELFFSFLPENSLE